MADKKHKPSANGPHSVYVLIEEYWKDYIIDTPDKFLEFYPTDWQTKWPISDVVNSR